MNEHSFDRECPMKGRSLYPHYQPACSGVINRDQGVSVEPVIDRAASRLAQIDATYSQFYEDVDPVTFGASFSGNQAETEKTNFRL